MKSQLTDEVQAALRAQTPEPTRPDPAPHGQVRYMIAVEDSQQSGTAPPAVLAALLRAAADQLDPPRKVTR